MTMQNLFAPIMAQGVDPASAVATLGGVMLVLGLAFLFAIIFSAIFIHLASKLLSFSQTFGTAMIAVLWQMLFSVVLFVLLVVGSVIIPALAMLAPFTHWASATLGIRQAYNTSFLRALAAAFLSAVLTVVALFVMLFVLLIATGVTWKQLQDQINKPKEPTTTVEWLRGDGSGAGEFTRSTPVRYLSHPA